MELDQKLQSEIVDIFRDVKYGRITFFVSPEKKTLDYSVETTGKLSIQQEQAGTPWSDPLTVLTK